MQIPNNAAFAEVVALCVESLEVCDIKLNAAQVASLWDSKAAWEMFTRLAADYLGEGDLNRSVVCYEAWSAMNSAYVEVALASYPSDLRDYVTMRGLSGVTNERGGGQFSAAFQIELIRMGLPADPRKWNDEQAGELAEFVKANRRAKR